MHACICLRSFMSFICRVIFYSCYRMKVKATSAAAAVGDYMYQFVGNGCDKCVHTRPDHETTTMRQRHLCKFSYLFFPSPFFPRFSSFKNFLFHSMSKKKINTHSGNFQDTINPAIHCHQRGNSIKWKIAACIFLFYFILFSSLRIIRISRK